MPDFNSLIPGLREWNSGVDDFGVSSWVGHHGSVPFAIGYSSIFWPPLVELEGYVLHEGVSAEVLASWERQPGIDRQGVEAVLNHRHILDLHSTIDGVTREQVVYLGRILREMYQAKLAWQFPGRRFEVWFNDSEESEDLSKYEITFFQVP